MAALTTLYTHSSWCSNRFAVFIDGHAPGTSIIPPSSGWIDPSFTKCIPTQYTTAYPTFSPGVCPAHMGIVDIEVESDSGTTIYTATCCQRYVNPMQCRESPIKWCQRVLSHLCRLWIPVYFVSHKPHGFPSRPEHIHRRHIHDAAP